MSRQALSLKPLTAHRKIKGVKGEEGEEGEGLVDVSVE
jgi:hypothetical protein